MCSCHSILECCVTFSGVKLSTRSFLLFLLQQLKDYAFQMSKKNKVKSYFNCFIKYIYPNLLLHLSITLKVCS